MGSFALDIVATVSKMDNDLGTQRALELGRRNAEALTLIQNWCGHARVVLEGGVGMLEEWTGLPIGRRRMTCEFERQRGADGADLAYNALDYFDHNCSGCPHRQPVRAPDLSQLVLERAQEEGRRSAQADAAAEKERQRVQDRIRRRSALRSNIPATMLSMLDRLDEFDAEPTPERRAIVAESLRVTPQALGPGFHEILVELLRAGGEERSDLALEVLDRVGFDQSRLTSLALETLARMEAVERAGPLAAAGLDASHVDAIRPALPAILDLARPLVDWRSFEQTRPSMHEPLLAAYRLAPEAVESAIRQALRDAADKENRRTGAYAAQALLETFPDGFLRLTGDLRAAFSMPDDFYDFGTASGTVSDVFAYALTRIPESIDAVLLDMIKSGSEQERAGAVSAYVEVLERRRTSTADDEAGERRDREVPATPVQRLAFERVLDVFTRLGGGEDFRMAEQLLDRPDILAWDLLVGSVEPLLGVAALACDELAQPKRPSTLTEGPEAATLRALDALSRPSALNAATRIALEAVIHVVEKHPDSAQRHRVGGMLVDLFDQAPADSDIFRARLVEAMGKLARSRASVSQILSPVYRALTDASPRLRAAAAGAYAEISRAVNAANLPALLHESFLTLLYDSKVIVHGAALDALDDADNLPQPYAAEVFQRAVVWARTYMPARGLLDYEESRIMRAALEAMLRYRPERDTLSPRLGAFVVRCAGSLQIYRAVDFLRFNPILHETQEFPRLLIELLSRPDLPDHSIDDLLDHVTNLRDEQICGIAQELVKVGGHLWRYKPFYAIRCVQILSDAGAVTEARECADRALRAHEDAKAPFATLARVRAIRTAADLEVVATESILDATATAVVGDDGDVGATKAFFTEHFPAYRPRFEALLALRRHASGSEEPALLRQLAGELDAVSEEHGASRAAQAYYAFGRVLELLANLIDWVREIRGAEAQADRLVRAAQLQAREFLRKEERVTERVSAAFKAIAEIRDPDDVIALPGRVAQISLPLPIVRQHVLRPLDFVAVAETVEPRDDVIVAALEFRLNGEVIGEEATLTPEMMHDLDLEVRFSRWPSDVSQIVFEPLHVEPAGYVDAPRFVIAPPAGEASFHTVQRGRIVARVPHALFARPLELSYVGVVIGPDLERGGPPAGVKLIVHGQQHLRFECFDPRRNPFSGVEAVDARLRAIRVEARQSGIPDEELSAFLIVLGAIGNLAHQALADNMFPGKWSEADFQKRVQEFLRNHPRIGSELEVHPQAARGITDLSFRRIRIELKVDDRSDLSVSTALDAYGAQTARYVAASDRRCGVLVVLDNHGDQGNSRSIANNVGLGHLAPSVSGADLLLGIVIVQGNLAKPSDFSH